MNKLELIQALRDAANLSKSEAESVVNLFFNAMAEELAKGGRVEIRGLCSFHVREYGSYTGRKPQNPWSTGKDRSKEIAIFQSG